MNPLITINENLVLEGDYKISGPVFIKRLLKSSENIFSLKSDLNLGNLLEKGINLYTSNETKSQLTFKKVLVIQNNMDVNRINGKNVKNFVKNNLDEVQKITGLKIFENDIFVNGSCEATNINNKNLKKMNETILKKESRETQVVSGRIVIEEVSVNQ